MLDMTGTIKSNDKSFYKKFKEENVDIYLLAITILNFIKRSGGIRFPPVSEIGKIYPTFNINTERAGYIIFEFNDGEKTMDLEISATDKTISINYKKDNGDDNIFDRIDIVSSDIPVIVYEHIKKFI